MEQFIKDICTGFFQEAVLATLIFTYFIFSCLLGKNFYRIAKWLSVFVVILTAISMLKIQIIPDYYAFHSSFVTNLYIVGLKFLILFSSLFVFLLSKKVVLKKRHKIFDFYLMIMLLVLGSFCLISSNNFMIVSLAISIMIISSALLTIFTKRYEIKDYSLKYLVTAFIAFMVMLVGIAFIYIATGTLAFDSLSIYLKQTEVVSPLFNIGCTLCSIGLTFSIGIIPFSNWIPDIYEDTPTYIVAVLSTIPLISVFGIFSRLIVFVFQYTPMIQALLFVLGIASIYKGFLGALKQDNIKRYLGYSMMAQSGFVILGFSIANTYSISASLFYLVSFIIANLGFCAATILFCNVTAKINMSDLKGLFYADRLFSLAWIACLLSLAGFPVTSGFISKIYLFEAIAKCSELYLAFLVVIMLATVLGIYIYFKPITLMFASEKSDFRRASILKMPKYVLYICALLTILICLCPDKIIQICQLAAYQL